MQGSERWGSWSLTLLFISLVRGIFLAGGFPVGPEQCQLEEWEDAGNK